MTAQPLQIPGVDQLDPDVRTPALRLLANARNAERLPRAVDRCLAYSPTQLPGILAFLARFGFEAVRQLHGQDAEAAAAFVGGELEVAEAAQLLEYLDREVAEWTQGTEA